MSIRSPLRAASYQGVRIDHGAIAHPASRIDVHGRHARDASTDVAAIANAGSTGNNADAAIGRYVLNRKGRFIEPGLASGIDRHIHHCAHAKSDQDSLLHPGVHAPSGVRGTVRFGRTNLARVQRLLEALEEVKMMIGVSLRLFVE